VLVFATRPDAFAGPQAEYTFTPLRDRNPVGIANRSVENEALSESVPGDCTTRRMESDARGCVGCRHTHVEQLAPRYVRRCTLSLVRSRLRSKAEGTSGWHTTEEGVVRQKRE
jgi:hypothetical protein